MLRFRWMFLNVRLQSNSSDESSSLVGLRSAHSHIQTSFKRRQKTEVWRASQRWRKNPTSCLPTTRTNSRYRNQIVLFFPSFFSSLINLYRPNRVQELHLARPTWAGRTSAVNHKLSVNLTDLPNHPNLTLPLQEQLTPGCLSFLCVYEL